MTHTRASLTAVSAGVLASLVNSVLFAAARITSLTSFNSEALLARLTASIFGIHVVNGQLVGMSPSTWVFGLLLKLIIAGVVGWLYAKAFRGLRRSGWDIGFALGTVQWLGVGALLGLLPATGQTIGFYGSQLGWPTFVLFFTSQILFGAIVGGLYVPDPLEASARPAQEDHQETKKIAA